MTLPPELVRAGLVAAGLVVWFWTQRLIGQRAFPEGRIGDRILDLTEPWNRRLREDARLAHGLLIVTSAGIDLLGLFLIARAIFGPTLRPFLGLLILFGLRQVCQGLVALPCPEGMVWRDPGVPSLFVTYGVATDLFFSGHTAIAVYGALELAHWGGPIAAGIGAVVVLGEASAVLVLRAHYTMDVFTGAVTALWVWTAASALAPPLDAALARMLG